MLIKSTPQLAYYFWKGASELGEKKSGKMLAQSEQEVRIRLYQQNIYIRKIKKTLCPLLTPSALLTPKLTYKDLTLLTKQLTTLLATGIPILQALLLISNNHHHLEVKSILWNIVQAIEAGTPLSIAMRNSSTRFDPLYIGLVFSGEQTGNLTEAFERITIYREKHEQLRSKVIKALIYPSMVFVITIAVIYIMLTLVIPQFENMFSGFGAELPWFTRQVLTLSNWLQHNHLTLSGLTITTLLLLRWLHHRSNRFKLMISRIGLKIPILGSIFTKAAIAQFSYTLATTISAGISILNALHTCTQTSTHYYYKQVLKVIHQDIISGTALHVTMKNTSAFPDMVLQMIMIGEESGKLDDMLSKIATIYEAEIDNTVDNLGKILEPLIIVFLGSIIGSLVVAMYLPIFSLIDVIS